MAIKIKTDHLVYDASIYSTGILTTNSAANGSATTFTIGSAASTYIPPPLRHPKMVGEARPYAAALEAEIEEAEKMGLSFEISHLKRKLLRQDIEELTKGAGYPRVTDKDLEVMFEFPRLRRKVRWHNFKAAFSTTAQDMILELVKVRVESCPFPLIKGAKLRLAEAKEKGIFDFFQVVYPNVITREEWVSRKARQDDPALVGIAGGEMYLICSWDLPKDVAKVETDMKALKKKKIAE